MLEGQLSWWCIRMHVYDVKEYSPHVPACLRKCSIVSRHEYDRGPGHSSYWPVPTAQQRHELKCNETWQREHMWKVMCRRESNRCTTSKTTHSSWLHAPFNEREFEERTAGRLRNSNLLVSFSLLIKIHYCQRFYKIQATPTTWCKVTLKIRP